MLHVFLSHAPDDREQVNRLAEALAGRGVKVWLDRQRIAPGEPWQDAIRKAIKKGAFFVGCFSTRSRSAVMEEELMVAVDLLRDESGEATWFVPVLLAECRVPALSLCKGRTLLDFHWLDLFTDWDQGVRRLIAALRVDEIQRAQELIDEYGYMYTRRLANNDAGWRIENSRNHYVQAVEQLCTEFEVWYDPIKLVVKRRGVSGTAGSREKGSPATEVAGKRHPQ